MYGWRGKILRVGLTNGMVFAKDSDAEIARDFIGARGLAAKYLFDKIDKEKEG